MNYELNNTVKANIDESLIKKTVEASSETVFSDIYLNRCRDEALPRLNSDNLTVSIAIVDDKTMHKLNKQYRGKDKTTDVLSFCNKDEMREVVEAQFIASKTINDLGEIIISWPQTKKQAKEYETTVEKEFTRLLVHGLVHLAGFDHEKGDKEAKEMEAIEAKILSKIFAEVN